MARMTQVQRSEAMVERLHNATLRCLGRDGYAKLSINQIAIEAGASRGAVFHHFPAKEDIAVSAMAHFMAQRYQRLMARFAEAGGLPSLEQRLAIFRAEFMRDTPISLEITNIMRNDPDLARRVESVFPEAEIAAQLAGYTAMFPEAGSERRRRLVVSVLVALLRGLAIEAAVSGAPVDEHFELFSDMFLTYFRAGPKAPASP